MATAKGAALETSRVPASALRSRLARLSRRIRDARAGHRHRPLVAGVRHRRLPVLPPLRHEGRRHPESGAGRRRYSRRTCRYFGGLKIWDANPKIVEAMREAGALFHAEKITHSYMHCWRHKTPIIYRATTQWFAGMDDVPGLQRREAGTRRSARRRSRASRRREFFPSWGKSRLFGMIANRPGLDAVAPAALGRPAAVLRRQGQPTNCIRTRRRCSSSRRRRSSMAASRRGSRRRTRISASIRRNIASSPTRSMSGSTRGRRIRRCWAAPRADHAAPARMHGRRALSRRPLPRRLGSASRLVPLVVAGLVHAERRAALQGAADARLHRRRRRQEDVEVEGQRRRAAESVRHARRGDPAACGSRPPTTRATCRFPTRS